jgi:hypothetical protein
MNLTEEEDKEYLQSLRNTENEELLKNSSIIEKFILFCAKNGIILAAKNFSYIPTIGIVASYPNLLSFLNPNIELDKELLVSCDLLNANLEKRRLANGYYFAANYMVMAHPYFRRGFNEFNNWAPSFIDWFWMLKNIKSNLYIALDFNRVRINVDNSVCCERDAWFGAGFDKKINQIPDGITNYISPLDLNSFRIKFFFNDAYSLIISWKTKNGIKTFQAEEYKTEEVKFKFEGQDHFIYPVRYIHAEFDLQKDCFRHFDGAVHLYNEVDYYQMRDSDFNNNSKQKKQIKADSQKLFKMNGNIDKETWVKFTSHFFTGNPLIIEYFEGKYPKHITEMLQKVREIKNT